MLIQIVYCSAAAHSIGRAELAAILETSRRNNTRNELCGMLLYSGGSFFQVLEGEEQKIDELMVALENDQRHRQITVIIREPIAERSFCDWSMGYADISAIEAGQITDFQYLTFLFSFSSFLLQLSFFLLNH